MKVALEFLCWVILIGKWKFLREKGESIENAQMRRNVVWWEREKRKIDIGKERGERDKGEERRDGDKGRRERQM